MVRLLSTVNHVRVCRSRRDRFFRVRTDECEMRGTTTPSYPRTTASLRFDFHVHEWCGGRRRVSAFTFLFPRPLGSASHAHFPCCFRSPLRFTTLSQTCTTTCWQRRRAARPPRRRGRSTPHVIPGDLFWFQFFSHRWYRRPGFDSPIQRKKTSRLKRVDGGEERMEKERMVLLGNRGPSEALCLDCQRKTTKRPTVGWMTTLVGYSQCHFEKQDNEPKRRKMRPTKPHVPSEQRMNRHVRPRICIVTTMQGQAREGNHTPQKKGCMPSAEK